MTLVIKKTSWEDYLDPSGGAYVKALIMGAHGAGKTRSASFWPGVIFADCEAGRMAIADRGVPYVDIRSSADMDALLSHLTMVGKKPADKREYQTLVIDTFDAYQRTIIQERLRAEKKESLSGWADWGYLDGKMTQLIERLLNLPMNIVVNLHVKEVSDGGDEDGDNSILVRKARLKGDIKDTIFQDFDLIGQMETSYRANKGERVLERNIRWAAEPRFPNIRDRSGKLPRFTLVDFTDQDYWRIFNALTQGLDDMPGPETVGEIPTATPDAEIEPAGPDESGGPVEVPAEATKPKGARAPAKKAAAKKAATPPPAEATATIEEPQPTKATEPTPAPEPELSHEAEAVVNGKGTAEAPVVLPDNADVSRALLEAGNLRSLEHAHSSEGSCIKNDFAQLCNDGMRPQLDRAPQTDELPAVTEAEAGVTEVPEPAPTPTAVEAEADRQAEEIATRELGAEVISAPGARNEGECGFQPSHYRKFTGAPAGCAKDLTNEHRAKVNLSLLKAKATLCEACFDAFRAA